jgi:hypothetical protein
MSRALLAALLWLALAPSALAAEIVGHVAGLTVQDARGRWVPIEQTARATVTRGAATLPVQVGMPLHDDDVLSTTLARVRVALPDGETWTLSEASRVTVGERSLVDLAGEVWLELRRAFQVDVGTVEATVEGTRFRVAGGDPVRVQVLDGRVRVTAEGASVLVGRGHQVAIPADSPPGELTRWGALARDAELDRTWLRGGPTLGVTVLGGFGALGTEGDLQARLLLRGGLGGPWRLTLDGGVTGNGARDGLRIPVSVGLERDFGALAFGGAFLTETELRRLGCPGQYVALHFGGSASVRHRFALTRRLGVETELRAGYAETLDARIAVGLGVAL